MASGFQMDSDYALALKLQKEWEEESGKGVSDNTVFSSPKCNASQARKKTKPTCIVDPEWELIDPNPDARLLFMEFDKKYFWGKLAGVEVRWSPRMTLCAGVCCYEGRGGLCSVRLSKPLLQLRPRKDLVETLLHEMIHAYLFVTQNNRDRDGHGPEFCKHMNRINQESGTKITIYHSFHDEVSNYRQHWWRCDGPCKSRPPYHGYVKRAMNRAPCPRDPWWPEHQRTCGGTYTKVKEPEGYGIKKNKNEESKVSPVKNQASGTRDIRDMLQKKSPLKERAQIFVGGGKTGNASSTNSEAGVPIVRRLPGIGLVRNERPSSSLGRNPENYIDQPKRDHTKQQPTSALGRKPDSPKTNHRPMSISDRNPSTSKSKSTKTSKRKRFRDLCFSSDSEDEAPVKKQSFDGTERVGQSVVVEGFRSVSGKMKTKGTPTNTRTSTSSMSSTSTRIPSSSVSSTGMSSGSMSGTNTSNPITSSYDGFASSSNVKETVDSESLIANVACPVCYQHMPDSVINAHLDECLR